MTYVDFLKEVEGCKLKAYQDGGGVWTIGYGHTGSDVHDGLVWTQAQADETLKEDSYNSYLSMKKVLGATPATVNQQAAFVSFIFNLGAVAFANSTLVHKFKQGDLLGTAKEFIKWDHDNGKEIKGLLIRRAKELVLFLQ